ncbi:hypothetical protein LIX60_30670 [Streptomyces sp. S07_1.15]|uniref:hypothetical protein n=1 Tax=Streptomyces sp. S07_1.15 TaxID=2873925 RepID=UPI001D15B352|nr:hypothetical protein [Streptomyces sp. S07_1.15]MCC3655746.1 hypothetical protein [Streptomyces sp. S07_1.15]
MNPFLPPEKPEVLAPPSSVGYETLWVIERLAMPAGGPELSDRYLFAAPDGAVRTSRRAKELDRPVDRSDLPENPAMVPYQEVPVRGAPKEEILRGAAELRGLRQPEIVEALNARDLALRGENDWVDRFGSRVLVLNRSDRWRHAVSTALLGDWVAPLAHGRLGPDALNVLKAEAQRIYRQERPLWERGTRKGRLLSMDAPLGNGLSLYDLVQAHGDPCELVIRNTITDVRLISLLSSLEPEETAVLLALAEGAGLTWTEAAVSAGSDAPAVLGERVRRKVRRLVSEQERRVALRVQQIEEASR